jgi:hypothetical protein
MVKRCVLVLALLLSSLFVVGAAGAVDLYNNLGAVTYSSDSVSSYGPLADSFSTGAVGFNLADVKVLLSGSSSPGSISVDLYSSDSSPMPATLLRNIGALSDTALSSSPSVVDFSLASSYLLSANTRYWVMISSTSYSYATWAWAVDDSGTGVANEYTFNNGGVPGNGYTWTNAPPAGYPAGYPYGPYQMAVSGSPVPIPAAFLLFASGFAGLVGLKRKLLG